MTVTAFELCERAAALVLAAGFELRYTSRQTEARYYGFAERYGMLRVAAHTKKHGEQGMPPIVARVTMPSPKALANGAKMSAMRVESTVAHAIGLYMMRTRCPQ